MEYLFSSLPIIMSVIPCFSIWSHTSDSTTSAYYNYCLSNAMQ